MAVNYAVYAGEISKKDLGQLDGITTWFDGDTPSTGAPNLTDSYLVWSFRDGLSFMDDITAHTFGAWGLTFNGMEFVFLDSFKEFVDKIKEELK